MGVFTTQTLLSSVGVSKNRATPGAVAINWILKVLSTQAPVPFWITFLCLETILVAFDARNGILGIWHLSIGHNVFFGVSHRPQY